MKMIMVTQCCCGCTVRTGTLIIGILYALSSLLDFIFEVIIAGRPNVKPSGHGPDHDTDDGIMSRGEVYASAVISVVVFCACLALIYGTLKERLKFILCWIIILSVYSVVIVLYIVQIIITVIIYHNLVSTLYELPVLLIALALSAYSVIVVNSHYRNLKDGVTLPPRQPTVIVA